MNESLSREIVNIGSGIISMHIKFPNYYFGMTEEIPDQNILDGKIISVIITEQITVRSLLFSNIIFRRR